MELSIEAKCRIPYWYPLLSNYTFPTSFVKLHEEEIKALAEGILKGAAVENVISRLALPMSAISGNCFVSTDSTAPTDTKRFQSKRGAVYSPESAWRFLALSEKVRKAASEGRVEFICIRPFRRMNRTREFRLFVHNGQLSAMSQYWLIRHFRRLEGPKQKFWEKAKSFISDISWLLPEKNIVMDIYFTSSDSILIIDLNGWGHPTDPLLLQSWAHDWDRETGIKLISPPIKISGKVNVSF
ncbi:MAG: hypothetical protein A2017_05175 [Lentisphaerae bacterium GWF2_44_16]|nr:MAG: hypothetical protein A2017_05175 [Lentisphaerae bacterium GWF2_44_16]